ncbi:MAG: hypothetical protein HC924_14570 [Synechococcaceae cyanobacterium SM2_3_2]|nr:hypothetical protein [Synechococcaceae cyanobacterium SM2_3_2]
MKSPQEPQVIIAQMQLLLSEIQEKLQTDQPIDYLTYLKLEKLAHDLTNQLARREDSQGSQ